MWNLTRAEPVSYTHLDVYKRQRQGQRQKVLIHHIIAEGTHDEDAVKNLQNKDCSQQRLIEALKARLQSEIGYEEDIAPYARKMCIRDSTDTNQGYLYRGDKHPRATNMGYRRGST